MIEKQIRQIKLQPKYIPRLSKTIKSSALDRRVTELRISGTWLERNGFKAGDMVDVIVSNGQLVIRPSVLQVKL
ncbi:SymE family type I addiction module toxin [Psychrobacillus psychrotolerans]|uniref:SymE family type I addiction module toxin n=1 Tax=Psychrobacillus psychrotolerans TaxID=126156 RepID=UPI003BAFE79E